MNNYITIDGGTTNTRITLVKDYKIIDSIKISAGARECVDGNSEFKTKIKNSITSLLNRNKLSEEDIEKILASGMITSEYGLCTLDHILTPTDINQLHTSMYEITLEDISPIPFAFIRGVKTVSENLNNTDIMRGEETELMGIINEGGEPCLYILPGSHSKIIYTDKENRILHFSTMLTGEMLASLSQNTILKASVDLSNSKIDRNYLLKGYEYCKNEGINASLFKVRILDTILKCTADEIYSFFLGTILCGEIENILKSNTEKIVIGGKSELKSAMAQLLTHFSNKKITVVPDDMVQTSTVLGAIKIYEYINKGEKNYE